jgi:hypothetical protein
VGSWLNCFILRPVLLHSFPRSSFCPFPAIHSFIYSGNSYFLQFNSVQSVSCVEPATRFLQKMLHADRFHEWHHMWAVTVETGHLNLWSINIGHTLTEELYFLEYKRVLLATCFMLVSYLAYASTLKLKACSSKTSDDFQQTMWHYIPDTLRLLFMLPL